MGNVLLLGITSLLTDFSSEMVVPLLPFFIQSVGGGAVAIGLILGFGDAVAALLRVVSGWWADRTKRYRSFTLFGYLASALAKFGYVGATGWQNIAVIRPIERLGKGFRDAPRDAIISESIPASRRGFAFGVQRAMDSVGAILGSVAVFIFFIQLNLPIRTIFFISACVGMLAVLPVLLVRVPESLLRMRRAVRFGKIQPKARAFIAIATIFALANFSVGIFLFAAGTVSLRVALAAYIVLHIVDAVLSTPAGILSDRIGRRWTILIGYGCFVLVCLGFAVVTWQGNTGLPVFLVLFGLYGAFKAFIDASQRAFVSDLSPDEVRGTALGLFETCTGLAAIPAGLIGGVLYGIAPALAFGYGAVTAAIASVLLMIVVRRA